MSIDNSQSKIYNQMRLNWFYPMHDRTERQYTAACYDNNSSMCLYFAFVFISLIET